MSELNRIVRKVSVQDGGTYNITMANRYSLVREVRRGNWRQFLPAPTLLVRLSLTLMGRPAILRSRRRYLNTGSLGRHSDIPFSDLDQTRNTLGQLALAFAEAFDSQREEPDLQL
ncbi:FlgK family flagellar hook-associated protein [Escherichia coli]